MISCKEPTKVYRTLISRLNTKHHLLSQNVAIEQQLAGSLQRVVESFEPDNCFTDLRIAKADTTFYESLICSQAI